MWRTPVDLSTGCATLGGVSKNAIVKALDAAPLTAFKGKDPQVILAGIFGADNVDTSTYIAMGGTGAWVDGWLSIVKTPGGVFALRVPFFHQYGNRSWQSSSSTRGHRADLLVGAAKHPYLHAPDVVSLAELAMDSYSWFSPEAGKPLDPDDLMARQFVTDDATCFAWVFNHALRLAVRHGYAEASLWTLWALRPGSAARTAATQMRTVADWVRNVAANWEDGHIAEQKLIDAAAAAGATMTSYDVEKHNLGPVMLTLPRDGWATRANEVLHACGYLPAAPPPRPKRIPTWIVAA